MRALIALATMLAVALAGVADFPGTGKAMN